MGRVSEEYGGIPLEPKGPSWVPRPPSWALCLDISVCEEPFKAGGTHGKAGSSQEVGEVGRGKAEPGVLASA